MSKKTTCSLQREKWYYKSSTESVLDLFFKDKDIYIFGAALLAVMYFLFAISNTMFSSKADMEGTIETIAALLAIALLLYVLGFRISFDFVEKIMTKEVLQAVKQSTMFLLAPITIDVVLLGMVKVLKK